MQNKNTKNTKSEIRFILTLCNQVLELNSGRLDMFPFHLVSYARTHRCSLWVFIDNHWLKDRLKTFYRFCVDRSPAQERTYVLACDGQKDGQTEGRTGGWTDGRTDGPPDGRTDR